MKDTYRLSIIIPHYNSPELLNKLLSTIPDNDEIQTIVVDDRSPKSVRESLVILREKYAGREIFFLDNTTPQKGAGTCRNIGLENARGEWLLFADADDYFIDGFYNICKKYMESDYDIIFFTPTSIQLDTGNMDTRHRAKERSIDQYLRFHSLATESKMKYSWRAPWSILLRSSLIQTYNILFDEVPVANDVMFTAKAACKARKINASREIIYCVTRNVGSLTTKLDKETFEIRTQVLIRCFRYYKDNLSKDEFSAIEPCRIAIHQLLTILQRHYGLKFFMKYIKIFRKNGMLAFDIRFFHLGSLRNWIHSCKEETVILQRYSDDTKQ
ncbi:MAG: glycosyltransferase [Bacteroides fragilis]|nr:glycosyltransferase [Bacteroides fragilis]